MLVRFRRLVRAASMAGIVVLPVLQAWTILAYELTLSEGYGIEDTLFDRFSQLVAAKRRGGRTAGGACPLRRRRDEAGGGVPDGESPDYR